VRRAGPESEAGATTYPSCDGWGSRQLPVRQAHPRSASPGGGCPRSSRGTRGGYCRTPGIRRGR